MFQTEKLAGAEILQEGQRGGGKVMRGARLKLEKGVLGPNERNLDWPVQTVQSHWRFLSQKGS